VDGFFQQVKIQCYKKEYGHRPDNGYVEIERVVFLTHEKLRGHIKVFSKIKLIRGAMIVKVDGIYFLN
jgi:hypothetical protein